MRDETNHTGPEVGKAGVVMCEEEEKRGEKSEVGMEFIAVQTRGVEETFEPPQATQSQISAEE